MKKFDSAEKFCPQMVVSRNVFNRNCSKSTTACSFFGWKNFHWVLFWNRKKMKSECFIVTCWRFLVQRQSQCPMRRVCPLFASIYPLAAGPFRSSTRRWSKCCKSFAALPPSSASVLLHPLKTPKKKFKKGLENNLFLIQILNLKSIKL